MAQVIDAEIIRKVTEWLLPGLSCPCCGGHVRGAAAGAHQGSVSTACAERRGGASSCYGNVPPEQAAQVMAMLLGIPVSAGWSIRPLPGIGAAREGRFYAAMLAALAAEDVLAADETPVNVLARPLSLPRCRREGEADPEEREGRGRRAARAHHPDPGRRLTFLQAIASRRKDAIAALSLPSSPVPDHRRYTATSTSSPGWPASSSALST